MMCGLCTVYLSTWKMEAPQGVRQALSRLSLPVETNHLPQAAKRSERTHDSWRCSWYLSGLAACRTSTLEFSMPTASHSPVGQQPSEKIWDEKSCCCSCRPSLRSHDRTVLSSPPVHSFVPSAEMSIHDAPSVCPWN